MGNLRRFKLFNAIGLNSMLGRTAAFALALILATVMVAWIADRKVGGAADINAANQSERVRINHDVRELSNLLWHTETQFQRYMIEPNASLRALITTAVDDMITRSDMLIRDPWVVQNEAVRQATQQVVQGARTLKSKLEAIMDIRADPLKVFPAMSLMVNKLLPLNAEFLSAATLGVREAEDSVSDPEQRRIGMLFGETRYLWSQRINTFRVFATIRLGMFSSSVESTISATTLDIDVFGQQLKRNLEQLRALDAQGKLGLQQSEAFAELNRVFRAWNIGFDEMKSTLMIKDRWRRDIPMLRDDIQPHFILLAETLRKIETAVEQRATEDIGATTEVANQLSASLWLLTVVVVVATVLGVVYFEFQIRRPMTRVAQALKAEAAGEKNIALPDSSIQEARDLVSAFDDMRAQVRARQEEVQSREQRLRAIMDNTAEGIVTFDVRGRVESWNQAVLQLFGWNETEIAGMAFAQLIAAVTIHEGERAAGQGEFAVADYVGRETEVMGCHRNNTRFPLAMKVSRMVLAGETKYTALLANITERKALMENLRKMAEHDGLTGLFNRSYFQAELERAVERAKRSAKVQCALMYIDLDNFKYLNDTLGHAAGDRLLVEVARMLNSRSRRSDIVARLGGDEFTVLLNDIDVEMIRATAESFRHQLADYVFHYEGKTVDIGCSIGVSMIGAHTTSAGQVMSEADVACHFAKRGGRNRVHLFTADNAADVRTMSIDMGWSHRIKQALEHNRFVLVAQPVVETRTRATTGYEILIRMRDDSPHVNATRGGDEDSALIMPSGFLAAAERFGLITDIDAWVIEHAVRHLAHRRRGGDLVSYSINLSGHSLTAPKIAQIIPRMLTETGLAPSALTFEVTETAAIADMGLAAAFLSKLRALGCHTALDDFGVGMSSLAYLRDLPVDAVKIDGRFVKKLETSPIDQAMVRAMNDIAHALGKTTIAEFVENEAIFQYLIDLGVDYGQGYHLGKPERIDLDFLTVAAVLPGSQQGNNR